MYEKLQEHLKSNQYTWLVIGVAGFIGSNLLEALLNLNQTITGHLNMLIAARDARKLPSGKRLLLSHKMTLKKEISLANKKTSLPLEKG